MSLTCDIKANKDNANSKQPTTNTMKYERFNKWMTRIKIPHWVYHENYNGRIYRDLEKMLIKAYKLGIKHSKENT